MRVGLEARGKSFEVSNVERFLSGRHGRRRFLGKGRGGEKGKMNLGLRLGSCQTS